MSTHHHIPRSEHPLPPEVQDRLSQESEEDRIRLAQIWHAAERYRAYEPSEAEFQQMGRTIWTTLEQEIQTADRRSPLRLVTSSLRLVNTQTMRWAAAAACIVLLIGIGIVFWQQPVTVTTAPGERASLELPDGSQVELNSGSRLTYPRSFGDTRTVRLDGEAFFDVADDDIPFVVRTFNATSTVLGTEFNLHARPDAPHPATKLTVVSGTVQLASPKSKAHAVTLQAGQMSSLAAQQETPTPPTAASAEHALAWREGKFIMAGEQLGTILHEIERRYGVRVETRPSSLRYESLGVFIENPHGAEDILNDISNVLNDISDVNNYEYRATPGGYELYRSTVE